jgi:hypothetical protein
MKTKIKLRIVIFAVIIVILAGFSAVVMLLWNGCLAPAVNGVNPIGYFQAMGLLVLAQVLFGGFRSVGSVAKQAHDKAHRKRQNKGQGLPAEFRAIHDRWLAMSDEERAAALKKHGLEPQKDDK